MRLSGEILLGLLTQHKNNDEGRTDQHNVYKRVRERGIAGLLDSRVPE
jgi:hypothetical protein